MASERFATLFSGDPSVKTDDSRPQAYKIVILPHVGSAAEPRSEMSRRAALHVLVGVGVEGFKWENEVKLQ
ncbi:hypothetical protein JCM6882_004906 [Rhodosporidiobolus microsporus]